MFDLNASTALIATQSTYNPTASIIGGIVGYVIMVVALWPLLTKAGRPGWGAIIPIYNVYLLVKIAGYHGALTILFYVPIANIIVGIIVALGLGRAFGKGGAFSFFLLWLLSIIGYFIISFGGSTYIGDGGDASKRVVRADVGGPAAATA